MRKIIEDMLNGITNNPLEIIKTTNRLPFFEEKSEILEQCEYSCRMRNPERQGLKDLKRLEMA